MIHFPFVRLAGVHQPHAKIGYCKPQLPIQLVPFFSVSVVTMLDHKVYGHSAQSDTPNPRRNIPGPPDGPTFPSAAECLIFACR